MKFTLLYSADVEAARVFISEFDGKGDILSTPEECVAFGVGLGGYPTVVYDDSEGSRHVYLQPTSWQQVQAWADWIELKIAEPKPTPVQIDYTRVAFMRLFTLDEMDALIQANETPLSSTQDEEEKAKLMDVKRMWRYIDNVEGMVSMKDSLTINSLYLLVLDGFITEERFDQIKAGVVMVPA